MTTVTIPMGDELAQQLHAAAQRLGVQPEELARVGLEDWLRRPREDFLAAAEYVLNKNADLYRRLG